MRTSFWGKFKGPNILFEARIDYWIGPKLKPKKDLRFEPTSIPGIFLGYAIQPGFIWRNEHLVAPLKDLMEREFNEPVQVIRVNQLTVSEGPFVYPLKGRYKPSGKVYTKASALSHLRASRRWMPRPSKTWSRARRPSSRSPMREKMNLRSC